MITFKCLFFIIFSGILLGGCGHTTLVKTDPPGGYLTLDGESLGKVPEEGLIIKRKPGHGPVAYQLVYIDGFETRGLIERDKPAILPLGMATAAGLICLPSMCGLGACIANPGWLSGVLLGSVLSAGGCQALMAVASPWTLPLAGTMGFLGFLPAAILLKAEHLPRELVLQKAPHGTPDGPSPQEMPF